jgi:hypothetical protein
MDVSGRILRTRWMPVIHAGMTMIFTFVLQASVKIMNHLW